MLRAARWTDTASRIGSLRISTSRNAFQCLLPLERQRL